MPPKRKRSVPVVCLEDEMKFMCEWGTCRSVLPKIDDLINHVNQHLDVYFTVLKNVSDTDFVCMWHGCGADISSGVDAVNDFTRHVIFHVFHIKIKELGRIVVSKSSAPIGVCALDENSRNLIPELPERLCCGWKDCDMAYDNAEYFYRHVNQHADSYEGKCTMKCLCAWEGCNTLQTSRYRLKEHLRSHTQEKVIACPTCGALFSCRTKFLDHLRKQGHVEGLRYQCSHCSKRFATERLLRDHMRHHVNNYKCAYCDMTSPTPSGLKNHIKYRHSDERPYPCSHCSQSCKSSTDLRKHMAMFHELGPVIYRCNADGCSFSTKSASAISQHFRSHETGTAKYACHVCAREFIRGGLLTKHLKMEHKYKWPSGHKRFRYTMNNDGYLRLQTLRYESVQLVENMVQEDMQDGCSDENEEKEGNNSGDAENDELTIQPLDKILAGQVGSTIGRAGVDDGSYNLTMLVDIAAQQTTTDGCHDSNSFHDSDSCHNDGDSGTVIHIVDGNELPCADVDGCHVVTKYKGQLIAIDDVELGAPGICSDSPPRKCRNTVSS